MSSSSTHAFRSCLVLPSYNNAGTVAGVVERSLGLGLPVYVVDDGSTDRTGEVLAAFRGRPGFTLLTHPVNRGKAAAMQTAFAAAAADGLTHALTLDTDGQLDPAQAPTMLEASERHPTALVLGVRERQIKNYPIGGRIGRKLTNLLIRLECGVRVQDSQCGMRVYPLAMIAALPVWSGRYDFETEIITRAGWARTPIVEVPISCSYPHPSERISHYRPWIDTARAVVLHMGLLLRRLVPLPHPQWPGRDQAEDVAVSPVGVAAAK